MSVRSTDSLTALARAPSWKTLTRRLVRSSRRGFQFGKIPPERLWRTCQNMPEHQPDRHTCSTKMAVHPAGRQVPMHSWQGSSVADERLSRSWRATSSRSSFSPHSSAGFSTGSGLFAEKENILPGSFPLLIKCLDPSSDQSLNCPKF